MNFHQKDVVFYLGLCFALIGWFGYTQLTGSQIYTHDFKKQWQARGKQHVDKSERNQHK